MQLWLTTEQTESSTWKWKWKWSIKICGRDKNPCQGYYLERDGGDIKYVLISIYTKLCASLWLTENEVQDGEDEQNIMMCKADIDNMNLCMNVLIVV